MTKLAMLGTDNAALEVNPREFATSLESPAVKAGKEAAAEKEKTNTPIAAPTNRREPRPAPESWPAPLKTVHALFELACGRDLARTEGADARRLQLVTIGLLCSLVFSAIWGVAAGSMEMGLSAMNLVKVPLVVLLSILATLPASLLALRLTNIEMKSVDFMVAVSGGTFAGTLALSVLAPLVAVYYQTSAWAGPVLAIGSVFVALLTGVAIFVRGVFARRPSGTKRRHCLVPMVTQLVMLALIMVQMVALASPILPEMTIFDAGIDGMMR